MGSFHLRIDGCIFLFADKAGEVFCVQCDAHFIITSKRFAGPLPARKYLGISVPFPPGKVKVKILGFHTILIVFFCFFIQNCSHRQFHAAYRSALLYAEACIQLSQPVKASHNRPNAVPKSIFQHRQRRAPRTRPVGSPCSGCAPCQRSGPAAPVLPAPAADPAAR